MSLLLPLPTLLRLRCELLPPYVRQLLRLPNLPPYKKDNNTNGIAIIIIANIITMINSSVSIIIEIPIAISDFVVRFIN